jgi:hypothetical protein
MAGLLKGTTDGICSSPTLDRIGTGSELEAAALRHQHRQGSNRAGGGGKPGRETDHNRPELELGRTLPPVD